MDVAADAAGNVYIADGRNHRVRRVDADGTISTVAGTGARGYSGDGGSAEEAQVAHPRKVDVDASGRVYVADTANRRIRRIDSSGVIATFAGTGNTRHSGDGGPSIAAGLGDVPDVATDSRGNVYAATGGRIRKIDRNGTISAAAGTGDYQWAHDGGTALATPLYSPGGVAMTTSGDLVFTDRDRVWRLDA